MPLNTGSVQPVLSSHFTIPQGRLLDTGLTVLIININLNIYQDADIPNQSVIHAVRGGRWSARSVKGLATPLSKVCLATVGEEDETEGAANAAAARGGNSIHFSSSVSNGCRG